MASCRRCEKSGWLLRVDEHGVCASCRRAMKADALQRKATIEDLADFVAAGERLELRVDRCESILEHAGVLRSYGKLGVWIEGADPAEIASRYRDEKRQLLHAALSETLESARERARETSSASIRRGAFERGLEKVEALKDWLDDPREARRYEDALSDGLSRLDEIPEGRGKTE